MDKLWKILVVDDEAANLEVLRGILAQTYVLAFAKNGDQALDAARRHQPDLILLDVMMPGMDGYEVCLALKADPDLRQIPVIFVTAMDDTADQARGFEVGGIDYITKPISGAIVRARIRAHVALVDQGSVLERLCVAGEYKDNETGAHVRRMGRYAEILAHRLGWSPEACRAIGQTAPMHDIGKIGIPDRILLKPGKLDPDELAIMQTHAEHGAAIIGTHGSALVKMASIIALSHHEKWDGSGYPQGLRGETIPMAARMVALADVYDALLSRRPYKEPWPKPRVMAYFSEQTGRHFDPALVPLFLDSIDDMERVRAELPD
jgi:putative two-component system response regulator